MLILKASAFAMRMDRVRRELLRLQKTSFFEATSSSRGGIYYKCFLKIVTKFGAVLYPSYSNNPFYARKTPPSSKTVVFDWPRKARHSFYITKY